MNKNRRQDVGGAASFLGRKTAVGPQNHIKDANTTLASLNQKLRPRQPDGRGDEGGSGNHGFRGGSLVSFWPLRKTPSRWKPWTKKIGIHYKNSSR
jgi:hypothetical protein